MEELKIPGRLKNNIQDFIEGLKDIYQQDLISVILYGSAASAEFIDKRSNINLLAVLNDTGLENLSKASKIINRHKFHRLNPLFLTEKHINSSTDIFPIEFLDMRENYFLLYGRDVLQGINIDTSNLRFQCEQELRARLINLRQVYLRINKNNAALKGLLFKSITSILHILRNVLRLKGKNPPYRKDEILKEIAAEFQIDTRAWERVLSARNRKIKLSGREAGSLFINFAGELEKMVDIVDGL